MINSTLPLWGSSLEEMTLAGLILTGPDNDEKINLFHIIESHLILSNHYRQEPT